MYIATQNKSMFIKKNSLNTWPHWQQLNNHLFAKFVFVSIIMSSLSFLFESTLYWRTIQTTLLVVIEVLFRQHSWLLLKYCSDNIAGWYWILFRQHSWLLLITVQTTLLVVVEYCSDNIAGCYWILFRQHSWMLMNTVQTT